MSGSSRSLIRILNTIFDNWTDNEASISDKDRVAPTPDITELFKTIASFHDKHNTLQSIKSSNTLNDDLFKIYYKYILSDNNLQKELFFLELLKQILLVLNEDEVYSWLKKYLKPAIDSAGFDLQFVSKSREFINELITRVKTTNDELLLLRRNKVSEKVVDYILRIYIGGDEESYSIIDFHVTEFDEDNQIIYERVRFIRKNCADILQSYGLKNPKGFFELINVYFRQASLRLKVLPLLSQVISHQASRVHDIVTTRLFPSLLNSLLYDLNEGIVLVSLSILVMIIPQLCDVIPKYLPDLMVIYSRLSAWKELDENLKDRALFTQKYLDEHSINWDLAGHDSSYTKKFNSAVSLGDINPINFKSYPTNSRIELDVSYFITLIYGLFPVNLKIFYQGPLDFFKNQPPTIISTSFLHDVNDMILDEFTGLTYDSLVKEKTGEFLKRFMLHPNFLKPGHLAKDELMNPIAWLLDINTNEDIVCEEVCLGCLNLNPDLLYTIPDSLILDSLPDPKINGNRQFSITPNSPTAGFVYNGAGKGLNIISNPNSNSSSRPSSNHASRSSSLHGPMNFAMKDGTLSKHLINKPLQNLSRKLSVIQTSLYIDNNYNAHNNKNLTNSKIEFKDVRFDKGLEDFATSKSINIDEENENEEDEELEFTEGNFDESLNTSNKQDHLLPEPHVNEPLNDLFSTHEKLYAPNLPSRGLETIDDTSITSDYAVNTITTPSTPHLSAPRSASSFLNDKLRNDLNIQRPVSSPTTSVETTTIHKDSLVSNGSHLLASDTIQTSNNHNAVLKSHYMSHNHGSSIDFYQRELLLMKNELEFSSYMKHLNKFHYIRVKLRLNKLLRESASHSQSLENKNNLIKLDNMTVSLNNLTEAFNTLRLEKDDVNLKMRNDKIDLTNQLLSMKSENESLKENLNSIISDGKIASDSLLKLLDHIIPDKEHEIHDLKVKLSDLEKQRKILIESHQSHDTIKERNEVEHSFNENFDLNDYEQTILKLRNEIAMLNENNSRVNQELNNLQELYESTIKNYESKLSISKLELSDEVYNHTIQYEKKIQELSKTIRKFEDLLEEKNAKIIQLSTSKPISIPGAQGSSTGDGGMMSTPRMYNNQPYGFNHLPTNTNENGLERMYDPLSREKNMAPGSDYSQILNPQPHFVNPRNNSASGSHTPVLLQPQVLTQTPPIVRGRGGYQKRSKKHM